MGFPSAGRFGAEAIISVLGVPVTSTPVTVYNRGTLSPTTLYTDQTMGASTTNPINTDGLGNLTFYAQPGLYDLAFTVGGVPTTQIVEVLPWVGDFTGMPIMSDYTVLCGAVPTNPRFGLKTVSQIVGTNGSGIAVVSFPTAFTNALTGLTACIGDTSGFALELAIVNSTITLAGFSAEVATNFVTGTAPAGGGAITSGTLTTANSVWVRINYIAVGC